ncbi:hypothetical protein [Teichococcus aestuarii]|uniref:hypothetical protein n=1 Tax=Teichococcus aestuarii TaxID=568898 RepID=UPI003616395C
MTRLRPFLLSLFTLLLVGQGLVAATHCLRMAQPRADGLLLHLCTPDGLKLVQLPRSGGRSRARRGGGRPRRQPRPQRLVHGLPRHAAAGPARAAPAAGAALAPSRCRAAAAGGQGAPPAGPRAARPAPRATRRRLNTRRRPFPTPRAALARNRISPACSRVA